ncbi:MAG: cation:proton antiporter [Oscillospiraceae bacterium]
MENRIILEVALMLASGILFGRLAKQIKSPNVTGYLIAGLLLGPSALNLISSDMVNDFTVVSDMALSFIAFSIGSEFDLNYYRKVGLAPIIIAIAESSGAIIFVTVTLILLGFDKNLSIMLGAIAAATAPAQTIMVINQYRAKGSLTSILMSVVALDDATALIGFGIASTIVRSLSSTADTHIILSILQPFYEILVSFVLGLAVSVAMKLVFRWFKKPSNRISIIISGVLGTYWLAELVGGSPLLACMSLGGVLVNIFDDIDNVMKVTEAFTPPILMIFFVISGAGFDVSALAGIGVIGVIYVVARVAGKMIGAWLGGVISKQEKKICRYLGPTLMPQAGVALGLTVVAGQLVPEYATDIRVIILCSTFIYSLIGPIAAKFALEKAGEIVTTKKIPNPAK